MEREHHYSVAVVWTGNTDAGIVVVSYEDNAEGSMIETAEGGRFTNVTLRPAVKVTALADRAEALHKRAHELCFLARSVNFPVEHVATTERV